MTTAVAADIGCLPQDLAGSGLAALALSLARELDAPGNSATSKSMCSRVLFDVLTKLREMAPPVEEVDELDDLTARRSARLGGA